MTEPKINTNINKFFVIVPCNHANLQIQIKAKKFLKIKFNVEKFVHVLTLAFVRINSDMKNDDNKHI